MGLDVVQDRLLYPIRTVVGVMPVEHIRGEAIQEAVALGQPATRVVGRQLKDEGQSIMSTMNRRKERGTGPSRKDAGRGRPTRGGTITRLADISQIKIVTHGKRRSTAWWKNIIDRKRRKGPKGRRRT